MRHQDVTVCALGSSVAWGFPYAPRCDITTILAQTWSDEACGFRLTGQNEAHYGVSSANVLQRARALAQASPGAPQKRLALVYSGNNEFLHLQADPALRGRGPALMTKDESERIVAEHRANLDASVTQLRASGVEVVLSTIPANLRDWPPTYTVRDESRAMEIEETYAQATTSYESGETTVAAALLGNALRSVGALAQFSFLMGQIHLSTGQTAAARQALSIANDVDGRPIRATSAINANIRSLADNRSVRLLDAEAAFTANAPDGVCGNDQFWDDCHPFMAGYLLLADLFGVHIADIAGTGGRPDVPSVDEVYRHHGIDDVFLADVYARMGLYCYKHSACWDDQRPLDLAERFLQAAAGMAEPNVEAHVALALVKTRRRDEAATRREVRRALEVDRARALWLLQGREAQTLSAVWAVSDIERWARRM